MDDSTQYPARELSTSLSTMDTSSLELGQRAYAPWETRIRGPDHSRMLFQGYWKALSQPSLERALAVLPQRLAPL